jgi:hypothetical protein
MFRLKSYVPSFDENINSIMDPEVGSDVCETFVIAVDFLHPVLFPEMAE